MKATLILTLLVSALLNGCAHPKIYLRLQEDEIDNYKANAISAINDAGIWEVFGREYNGPFTLKDWPATYIYENESRLRIFRVILDTTKHVGWHTHYIEVRFNMQSGEIIDIWEAFWP